MGSCMVSAVIKIDGLPLFHQLAVKDGLLVARIEITVHIPATANIGVEGVRFAFGRAATLGAIDVQPIFGSGKCAAAVTTRLKVIQLWQYNWEVFIRH